MERSVVTKDEASDRMKMIPLSEAPAGQDLRVVGLDGGHGMKRRLTDMGLHLGSIVRVASSQSAGPIIVWCKGTRIALGRGIVRRVRVEPL